MAEQSRGKHLRPEPSGRDTGRDTSRQDGPAQRPARPAPSAAGRSGAPERAQRPASTGRAQQPVSTGRVQQTARSAAGRGQQPQQPAQGSRAQRSAQQERARQGQRPGGPSRPGGPGQPRKKGYPPTVKYAVLAPLLILMIAAVIVLASTKLLPVKYLLLIGLLLALILALVAVLVWKPRKRGRFWTGAAIAAVMGVALLVGCIAGVRGISAMKSVTSPTYTSAHIGVYVRTDDPAQALEELADRTFGIMAVLGREDVDEAIADMNEAMNTTIKTAEYDSPLQLVDALLDGEVDAAIIDVTFIEGLDELDDYKQKAPLLREITDLHVERPVEVTAEPEPTTEAADGGRVITALISGIDSRGGLVRSSRSDVNILLTVNTATKQVLMVSTPRDYYVTFSNTGTKDKLTHTGYYGIDTCMGTMSALYDIKIDYYFRVNFSGFVDIIDALGGVTVESPKSFTSRGYSFKKGENKMDGAKALVFARERYAFIDGDRQRGKNQMAVIKAVIKKALSPEILGSYSSLLNAVEGSFETTVPYDLISELVRQQLDEGGDWNIVSYSVTGSDAWGSSPLLSTRVYVMQPDMSTVETAKELMQKVRDGETVTAP